MPDSTGKLAVARIALNRFGLGARPGEAAAVAGDPGGWLMAQVSDAAGTAAVPGVPDSASRLVDFIDYKRRLRAWREANSAAEAAGTPGASAKPERPKWLEGDVVARLSNAIGTERPFSERLAMFWSNHLSVSARKGETTPVVVPYENEAIRPHVNGRFSEMLKASAGHPAMMAFLDSRQSIGPDSPAGLRTGKSYNENYARELMELHTLGVDGGYTQADVVQAALILTGLSIEADGRAVWRPQAHEPGPKIVLNRKFEQDGEAQADALLEFLSVHPRTARRLSEKLASHFVSDEPPTGLVDDMSDAWISSGGHLPSVYRAMLVSDFAWSPIPAKYKTPEEFAISAARALSLRSHAAQLARCVRDLADAPFTAADPRGFDDSSVSWMTPGAVLERVRTATEIAVLAPRVLDPSTLLSDVVGVQPGSRSLEETRRAPSQDDGMTLFLASPEFQRR
jgi:uncharacterized protein (DUF1800 family)